MLHLSFVLAFALPSIRVPLLQVQFCRHPLVRYFLILTYQTIPRCSISFGVIPCQHEQIPDAVSNYENTDLVKVTGGTHLRAHTQTNNRVCFYLSRSIKCVNVPARTTRSAKYEFVPPMAFSLVLPFVVSFCLS